MQGIKFQHYANKISGERSQTHAGNIHSFKTQSICSNREVSSMFLIEYSSTVNISKVARSF